MDHIFFDQSFITTSSSTSANNSNSNNNNTQQLHAAILFSNNNNNTQNNNNSSQIQQQQRNSFNNNINNNNNMIMNPSEAATSFQDSIPLELRLQGLPNRPVGSPPMKVADRLPLEMAGGMPCFREDLEQLIRTKLICDLHCPPSVSFDICQSDEWLVDEKLFDKVRDEYSSGRRRGVWSLNVTILSLGGGVSSSVGTTSTTAPSINNSNNNNNHISSIPSTAAATAQQLLTAAALKQHLSSSSTTTNTSIPIPQQQQQQSSIMQMMTTTMAATPTPTTSMLPTTIPMITRTVSIAMLRNNTNNISTFAARGSWTIIATVVEIRQKSDAITELHLAQPELDPRARISAVTFNSGISRNLRDKVFQHCEIQIERANLVAKSEMDKRYQRDDHPYKIVIDLSTNVTVVRSAQDNVAAAAILRAATVVVANSNLSNNNNFNPSALSSSSAVVSRVGAGGIVNGFAAAVSNNNNNNHTSSFSSNSSTTANIGPVTQLHQQNFNNNNSTVGIISSKLPLIMNNNNQQHYNSSTRTATTHFDTASTIGVGTFVSSSNSSSSSGGTTIRQQQQHQMMAIPSSGPKRTLFITQQQQQSSHHHHQSSFEHKSVLGGAPNPSRQDIESRDGVVALETATSQILDDLNIITRSSTSSSSTNCVQTCFFCGVDSDSPESIETFKKRLEKVYKKTCSNNIIHKNKNKSTTTATNNTSTSSSLASFLPSKMEEYQFLFGDPRIALKRNSNKNTINNNRLWCRTRVTDPMTRKNHRIHPRCAHVCWEYQQNRSMKLAECSPNAGEECRICELCGEAGAVTKCYDPTCSKWFHSSCAIFAKGYIDFGQYDPFRPCASCPQHAYLSFKKDNNKNKIVSGGGNGVGKENNRKNDDDDNDDEEELLLLGATTTTSGNRRRGRDGKTKKMTGNDDDDEDDEDDDDDDALSFLDPTAFDARKVEAGDLRDPDDE